MATFIRLCLCILLAPLALGTVIMLLVVVYGLYQAHSISHRLGNTTCAEYIAVLNKKDPIEIKQYADLIRHSTGEWMGFIDPELESSKASFRDTVNFCVEKPQKSVRASLLGYTEEEIDARIQQTLSDELMKINAPREAEERRKLLNADYTAPNPAASVSPTLNTEH